jgi:hypothetical protein
MRGIKFKKSHIHILESETLSREYRVTESAQEIVDSISYICEPYTYVYHMSSLLYYCWWDVLQVRGDITLRVSDCEELLARPEHNN